MNEIIAYKLATVFFGLTTILISVWKNKRADTKLVNDSLTGLIKSLREQIDHLEREIQQGANCEKLLRDLTKDYQALIEKIRELSYENELLRERLNKMKK